MYTTIPKVFGEGYGFNTTQVGLSYLGNGIGATIALYTITKLSDVLVVRHKAKHGSESKPEIRLLPLLYAGPLLPIGLLWYGWSAQARNHWIVPILGSGFFAAGVVAASVCNDLSTDPWSSALTDVPQLPANMYVVDAYTKYAASAMAGSMLLRSIAGGLIPLAGNPMFVGMGVGWGCSLLAFIAVLMCLLSIPLMAYGERLREREDLKL